MEQFLEDIKDLEVTTVARAQKRSIKRNSDLLYRTRDLPLLPEFAAKLATVVAETKLISILLIVKNQVS